MSGAARTTEKIKDTMPLPKFDPLVDRLEIAFGSALAAVMREAKAGRLTTPNEQREAVERFRRDLSDAAIDLLPEGERALFVLEGERQLRQVWPKLLRLSRVAPRRTSLPEFINHARRQIASVTRHTARTHGPQARNGHPRARERSDGTSRRRQRASPDQEGEKPGRGRRRARRRWSA